MLDPKVIGRLKRGDGAALKKLFKSHAGKLYSLAYRLTGDRTQADLVVRGVFQELWKRRTEIDPLVQLDGALMRETFLSAKELQGGVLEVHVPLSGDPQLEPLLDALERMSNLPRLIFLLYAVDGFDHKDIARTLDVPRETVLSYLGKALEDMEDVVQQGVY